jgi:hypothetical protein
MRSLRRDVFLIERLGLKYGRSRLGVKPHLERIGLNLTHRVQPAGRDAHSRAPRAGPQHGAYPGSVLRKMRDPTGGPTVRVRLVALLAALGLLVVTAPVVVPLVRWIADLVW